MARWRLTEPHYLFTDPGTKWEYVETDRTTGRQVRKQYEVPQYFHHEAEADWNEYESGPRGEKLAGSIVVSDGRNAKPRDIVFKGNPTPGMDPIDDEAKAITAQFKDKWNLPDNIKWGPGEYTTGLTDWLVTQQDKVSSKMAALAEKNTAGFGDFMKSMTEMMQQNQKILEMLTVKSNGERNGEEGSAGQDNRRPAGGVRRRGRPFGSRRAQGARQGRPRVDEPGQEPGPRPEERGGGDVDPSAAGGAAQV
jgi:hypothetical protein